MLEEELKTKIQSKKVFMLFIHPVGKMKCTEFDTHLISLYREFRENIPTSKSAANTNSEQYSITLDKQSTAAEIEIAIRLFEETVLIISEDY